MSFNSELDYQKKEVELHEIDMTESPKAFMRGKGERRGKKLPYMGVEWEVKMRSGTETKTYDRRTKRLGKTRFGKFLEEQLAAPVAQYVNFRDDGSLLEMVSVPATLAGHKRWMEKHLFSTGITRRSIRHDARYEEVGLHIHISKAAFNAESLERFIGFVRGSAGTVSFMKKIAGRNRYYDGAYWPSISLDNDLCCDNDTMKFTAVNTNTEFDTIEVRVFNSPRNKKEMYARLEFCDALVYYTRDENNPLNQHDFTCYVNENSVKYPNLHKLLDQSR